MESTLFIYKQYVICNEFAYSYLYNENSRYTIDDQLTDYYKLVDFDHFEYPSDYTAFIYNSDENQIVDSGRTYSEIKTADLKEEYYLVKFNEEYDENNGRNHYIRTIINIEKLCKINY